MARGWDEYVRLAEAAIFEYAFKLIRKECCNCVDGNCVLLDDGRYTFSTQQ
ncbi:MAG: cysteine-rich VLP protein [Clostridia bacterium]|nr:cysteine-rich VLP protein [Clostridia bacterium]